MTAVPPIAEVPDGLVIARSSTLGVTRLIAAADVRQGLLPSASKWCNRSRGVVQGGVGNFLNQLTFWSIAPIFDFIADLHTDGMIQRCKRIRAEQASHGCLLCNREEIHIVVTEFADCYHRHWHRKLSPLDPFQPSANGRVARPASPRRVNLIRNTVDIRRSIHDTGHYYAGTGVSRE